MLFKTYRLVTGLGAPLISLYLKRRRIKGKEDAARFAERFGQASLERPAGRLIWCHAASVGEAASFLLLINKLHEAYPDIRILLTTGTVAAARTMQMRLPSYALHQYTPVDVHAWVNRFLDHWRPMLALWVESELWPNTLLSLRARAIPVLLLNARMSDKSFRNWGCVKGFAAELLSCFSLCLAQSASDRDRFLQLGAPLVKCAGNLKYAANPLPFNEAEKDRLREAAKERPLWLMASTHPGEEELALEAHKALAGRNGHVLTILAPRHAARGEVLAELIKAQGLRGARRSKGEPITPETHVYLADTMGEMGLFYALSPVAVLGGSFVPIGGHNPIEPAQQGAAILFGPHMHNFDSIACEFLAAGAALQLEKAENIAFAVESLWKNEDRRQKLVTAAKELAEQKRHILNEIVAEISPWMKGEGQ